MEIYLKNYLYHLTVVLVAIISFLLTPFFIFNWIFFSLFRGIVLLAAWLFRPDLEALLDPVQGAMALEKIHSKPKMNILVYNVLDGTVSVNDFRSHFEKNILNLKDENGKLVYPELKQFKTEFLNKYFWKLDKNFDLKNHIRVYDYPGEKMKLPKPCNEADLEKVTGELLAHPWKKGQSPWEILFIHDYRVTESESPKTVFVFRIHHSLTDGYGILKIIWRLLDNPSQVKFPQPTFPELSFFEKCVVYIRLPFFIYYYLAINAVDGFDFKNSWHLTDKKLSRKFNTCIVKPIPISVIKAIKQRYAVGYNSVLAAIVSGGIRKVMEENGQKIPESIGVFMPLPLPDHPDGLGIHAAGQMCRWPMSVSSPAQRMKAINESVMKCRSWEFFIGCQVLLYLVRPYPVFIGKMLQSWAVKCTALFSSFPAFESLPTLMGMKITDSMFTFGLPPGKPGASITLLSIGEHQRIVVTVDRTVLDYNRKLANVSDYIHQELRHLLRSDGGIV